MIAAESMLTLKLSGNIVEAIDHERLMDMIKKYNR